MRNCTRRINFELKQKVNCAESDKEEPTVASVSSAHRPEPLNLVNPRLATSNQLVVNSDGYDDTTMPTWGLSGHNALGARFDYGAGAGSDSDESDAGKLPGCVILSFYQEAGAEQTDSGSDSDSDLGSGECTYEPPIGVEVDYTSGSGSEADIDTEDEMYPELDVLEYISPIPTRSPSPISEDGFDTAGPSNLTSGLEGNQQEDPKPPETVRPSGDDLGQATEGNTADRNVPEPPDALRAFREWILKMSSTGDLTVEAAESLLKTLNTCLEKDLLRCGPETNTAHRLPLTLETLQRQARQPSELMERYALSETHYQTKDDKTTRTTQGDVPLCTYTRIHIMLNSTAAPGNSRFQPSTRQGAASNSIGAISLCIANLPPHLRNLPENKILVGVTPGPHEPNVDTINNFLDPMVDELLELWNNGMTIRGESGELIESAVALVACACDSPAARKLGGFEFPRRTRKEHKRAAKAYRKLPNKSQKQKFISTRYEKDRPAGYRHSALLRLPYWDATTMVVVDPMHCLFLGVVDWQFHTIWVDMKHLRPGEELDELQTMVQSTIRPRHCGRPPGGLGTSAAGSLTSDPLRSLVTIDLPLAIPILWDRVDATSVQQRAHNEWALRKQLQEKRKAESRKGDKVTRNATRMRQQTEAAPPVQATSRPQKRARTQPSRAGGRLAQSYPQEASSNESDNGPINGISERMELDPTREQGLLSWRYEDAEGILWLSQAIKHLCSRTVTDSDIDEGHSALVKYLNMCAELRGPERCRPNHHMASHIAGQLRRFGPMHQIWTYSGERLNFTLKNTNSNRHGGGERERTFAVTFHRRRDCITRVSAWFTF
ncbi:hypothetical protein RSAG8_13520, partial [Rhizoctonia solani AG-8 WAC10335]